MRVVLAARRADRLATVAAEVTAVGGAARVVLTDAGTRSVRALIDGLREASGLTCSAVVRGSILATVEQTTPRSSSGPPRQLPRRRSWRPPAALP
jgi:hypothetical protein